MREYQSDPESAGGLDGARASPRGHVARPWPHVRTHEVVALMRQLFVEYCGGVEVI